jgi:hypothetical protein
MMISLEKNRSSFPLDGAAVGPLFARLTSAYQGDGHGFPARNAPSVIYAHSLTGQQPKGTHFQIFAHLHRFFQPPSIKMSFKTFKIEHFLMLTFQFQSFQPQAVR